MVQKLVLKNEVVKVKGRVKVITIKKEDFFKILKLVKLRVLNKEYEALMPPLDGLEKNTIDINGLATLVQQFMSIMFSHIGIGSNASPAQMVLTTESNNITLSYSGNIGLNSQGVTVYLQVLNENNNWTWQYFYIGFDTTNDSYSTTQIELYVSAWIYAFPNSSSNYETNVPTNLVRIAYTNTSFTKSSDSYLFIVWLIEFENIPPYLVFFTPTLQNKVGIASDSAFFASSAIVYFNNGSCNFVCGGNCPSAGLGSFITYIQDNNLILEFPLTAPLGTGVSNLEVLLCTTTQFQNMPTISGSTQSTLTPPVSGATFYVAIATITVTYQAS